MILVTGSTGFVGTEVLRQLSARGQQHRAASRTPKGGYFPVGDITGSTDWSEALSGVDAVIHLAARVHVAPEMASDALDRFRAMNVSATLNLARQFAAAGGRRFVFLSSVKALGDGNELGNPYDADSIPAPTDDYGRSKLEAERALFALGQDAGIEVVVVRPPLVYGPGVKANFAALFSLVGRGIPLPLRAVRNKRSLIYVGNLADFVIRCCSDERAAGQIFMVSDGHDLSTPELVTAIADAVGRPARLLTVPPTLLWGAATALGRKRMAQRLLGSLEVDIDKTRKRLGWQPPYTVPEGLAATARGIAEGPQPRSITIRNS